jgi:hypothetical protein
MVTAIMVISLVFLWTRPNIGFLSKLTLTLILGFGSCCGACISGCG